MLGPGARLFIEAEIEFNVPDLPVVEVVPRISICHDIRRDFELLGSQARSYLSFTHLTTFSGTKFYLQSLRKVWRLKKKQVSSPLCFYLKQMTPLSIKS